jgi:DeoR/GlpR family transcriptional regulator of sugar metabolism
MLANKTSLHRRLQIVELVRKRGDVSVEELSQAFSVSSVTIRSDLSYLERQRYLVRTFGRARYLPQQAHDNASVPAAPSAVRKGAEMAIARLAADCVDDHASVFIGAGDLTHKLLPLLADRSNLVVVLNDLEMVPTAQRFLHCELQLTGGTLNDNSTVLTGPDAERSLSARSLDLTMLEATGIDYDGNLLCADARLAQVYRSACETSPHIVVLAFQPSFEGGEPFCRLADLAALILDEAIDPSAMERFVAAGLHLHRRADGILEFHSSAPELLSSATNHA